MPPEDTRRNVVSAALMAHFALERGASLAALLVGTGLDAAQLADPTIEIRPSQELALVRNLLTALGDPPGIGLDIGRRYHLSTYGVWGFALLTSPTLRAAAEVVERYLALSYAFVRFRIRLDGDGLHIVLDEADVPADVRAFFLDRDFVAWANAMSEMLPGGLPLRGVRFRGAKPAHAARYTALCGMEPEFGAAENAVRLDPALLDLPLQQANPVMARLCLDQCRNLLDRRRYRDGYAGRVRDRLFQQAGSPPGLDVIAAELHLSPRSLRRHLEAEGTSFRTLSEEVLETLAEELLTTAHLKLEEVATRLGYAEPASFIHAFKRWKGMSPNAFREQYRAGNLAP
jgi:AraC-like DNA-binding protein